MRQEIIFLISEERLMCYENSTVIVFLCVVQTRLKSLSHDPDMFVTFIQRV